MERATPQGQSSGRTHTPCAPPRPASWLHRPLPLRNYTNQRLPNGAKFVEDLPERPLSPTAELDAAQTYQSIDEVSQQFASVDLEKSLPPSASTNSERRRTVKPIRRRPVGIVALPPLPSLASPRLQDAPVNGSYSPKVLPQDPNIRVGEIHLGTGLVPIAEAQAYREAQKAVYAARHRLDNQQPAETPARRPTLKRLLSKGLERVGSSKSTARQQAPAPASAPAAEPQPAPRPQQIKRKVIGDPNRTTRFSDFVNIQPSPPESQDGEQEADASSPPPALPTPPVPPRSQHRIPRKPIASRRQAPVLTPIKTASRPVSQYEAHQGEDPMDDDERETGSGQLKSGINELFDLYGRRTGQPQDEAVEHPRWSWEAEPKSLGHGSDLLLSAVPRSPRRDSVQPQYSPARFHDPNLTASVNSEINRMLSFEHQGNKRETLIVDTREHETHTSFVVTQFNDDGEVESTHYRQPKEAIQDQAMAVWERMERETNGVVTPVRSRNPSADAEGQQAQRQPSAVEVFARGLRDEEDEEEDDEFYDEDEDW